MSNWFIQWCLEACSVMLGFFVAEQLVEWLPEHLKRKLHWFGEKRKVRVGFLVIVFGLGLSFYQAWDGQTAAVQSAEIQDRLRADLAAEKERAVRLEQRLTEEHRERELLTKAVEPRIFSFELNDLKMLERNQPMRVAILYSDEPEAEHTAGQLAFAVAQSGWQLIEQAKSDEVWRDGIQIECMTGARREGDHSQSAANDLVKFLGGMDIDAHTFPGGELPINTLIVKVGPTPKDYFADRLHTNDRN